MGRELKYGTVLLTLIFSICCGGIQHNEKIKSEIHRVLNESESAWNEGDIEKYMECYSRSDSVRFAGNGTVSYGWQTVLERYKKGYPDKAAMGKLTFSDIDINVISKDAAVVFGRWKLHKGLEEPSGLFTLLFRKTNQDWRIVHDHSSSAKKVES